MNPHIGARLFDAAEAVESQPALSIGEGVDTQATQKRREPPGFTASTGFEPATSTSPTNLRTDECTGKHGAKQAAVNAMRQRIHLIADSSNSDTVIELAWLLIASLGADAAVRLADAIRLRAESVD